MHLRRSLNLVASCAQKVVEGFSANHPSSAEAEAHQPPGSDPVSDSPDWRSTGIGDFANQ